MNLPEHLVNTFQWGDCFAKLPELPDECVDLVLTDPPYGIDYQSNRRVVREKLPKFANDAALTWVDGWVDEIFRVLKPDRHFYCFTRFDTYPVFYTSVARRFTVKNCLIWVKRNHGSGDLNGSWAPQYEMIIFGVKGKRPLFGTRESDVLDYRTVSSAARLHPTQKPVELLRVLIEKSTEPDEIVLDPFAGLGSTGFACLAHNLIKEGDGHPRRYLLYEINADYVSNAVRGGLGRQGTLLEVARRPLPPPKKRQTLRTIRFRKDTTLPLPF